MPDEFVTPEWVKDAIFYQIFPDRFARSSKVQKPSNLEAWDTPATIYGFKGGDLMGVVEHLDYLQDLGITAIYLNPIFQSASNHRYHTHDYYQVDPLLGGNEAFKTFLTQAHHRHIRIILDGVFNHASRGFFQFNHILETGASSPYFNWFLIKDFPLNAYSGKPNYGCWFNLPALPEFNTDNPEVRQFIFDVARYWIEQGIDGWRLDVPACIDDDLFWQEFRHTVKTTNPQAYLVGEIAWEAQRWLQGDQFDAVMNYQFAQACLGFFSGNHLNRKVEKGMMGLPPTRKLSAIAFARRVEELLHLYPREAVLTQLNLLDSHDMPRFVALSSGDKDALRLAVVFQMTYPGAPCIYYGDEIGMADGKSNDPEASRQAFPWDEARWDTDLLNHYKRCIALRRAHPALRRGEFVILYAKSQVCAYLRCLADDILVVILNSGEQTFHIDFNIGNHLVDGSVWRDILGNGSEIHITKRRMSGYNLPPRSACILTCADA